MRIHFNQGEKQKYFIKLINLVKKEIHVKITKSRY